MLESRIESHTVQKKKISEHAIDFEFEFFLFSIYVNIIF